MSGRHGASRRRSYGPRQRELKHRPRYPVDLGVDHSSDDRTGPEVSDHDHRNGWDGRLGQAGNSAGGGLG